jgi:hypothetical protein
MYELLRPRTMGAPALVAVATAVAAAVAPAVADATVGAEVAALPEQPLNSTDATIMGNMLKRR